MDTTHHLSASTLAELRQIVADTEHLPCDSTVRVKTRLGFNADGTKLSRIHIATPREN